MHLLIIVPHRLNQLHRQHPRGKAEQEAKAKASSDSAAATAPSGSGVEDDAYPDDSTERSGEGNPEAEGNTDALDEAHEEAEDSCGESPEADGGGDSVAEEKEENDSADIRRKSADIPRREKLDTGSDEL